MTRRTTVRSGFALLAAGALGFAGCQTVTDVGSAVGQATGTLTPAEAEAIRKTGVALARALEDLTPEQEYYLGRTVAATLMAQYPPLESPELNRYVNLVGQAVALASDLPETFAGYHFQVLDSDEINAFATPGGFILVTRGLLRVCQSEDALASVLAHEVAHVQHRHGVRAIRSGRFVTAVNTAAVGAATTLGGEQWAEAAAAYEAGINDMVHTLVTGGYSRRQEREADLSGIEITRRAGYDPGAYVQVLRTMEEHLGHRPGGFGATHPPPAVRLRYVEQALRGHRQPAAPAARQARFERAMAGL